jgi:hypothetical protein
VRVCVGSPFCAVSGSPHVKLVGKFSLKIVYHCNTIFAMYHCNTIFAKANLCVCTATCHESNKQLLNELN